VRNTLVNPSPRLTRTGVERGWEIVRPPKPWQGGRGHLVEVLRRTTGL
jgi:hypothetical protein